MRHAPYLCEHGGGVTLSGGEPLLQPDFTADVLRRLRAAGLRTAVDTTGHGGPVVYDKVLPHLDRVLLCIKAPDPDIYARLTGGHSQRAALALADACGSWPLFHPSESGPSDRQGDPTRAIPITVRYVLLPGLTDSKADLDWLVRFCEDRPWVDEIDVLPYHTLGVGKWAALGLSYPLVDQRPPTPDELRSFVGALRERLEGAGVAVQGAGASEPGRFDDDENTATSGLGRRGAGERWSPG